jgi:hypothetical protein
MRAAVAIGAAPHRVHLLACGHGRFRPRPSVQRAFHDPILAGGAMSLDQLAVRIDARIAQAKVVPSPTPEKPQ